MSDLVVAEPRSTLCSAPMTMLRESADLLADYPGIWLDLCTHHVDESPCPLHDPAAPPQTYLADLSGQRGRAPTFDESEWLRRLFSPPGFS